MVKLKFDKDFLQRLKRPTYIQRRAFGMLIALIIFNMIRDGSFKSWSAFTRSLAIQLLLLFCVLVMLLPSIVVQLFGIKIENPKSYYFEPSPQKLAWIFIPAMILGGVAGGILGVIMGGGNIKVVGALAAIGVLLPVNIYVVNSNARYKRIIYYGSSEWHKHHDSKPPKN
jgi:hypothetical protein